jgi:hypothetical protein
VPKLRPVDVDFVDTAAVVLTTEVDLPASIDEVWDVIIDNESWPHWLWGCRSMSASRPVWADPGDTRRVNFGILKIDEVAVALDQPERWAMSLTRSTLPIAKAMLEMLDLTDTSRSGETRTEVRWTGALDRLVYLRPLSSVIESRLTDLWGRSLEALHDEVVSRR